jgi:hypothetical protein
MYRESSIVFQPNIIILDLVAAEDNASKFFKPTLAKLGFTTFP